MDKKSTTSPYRRKTLSSKYKSETESNVELALLAH